MAVELRVGNALELIKDLPDKSIDCVMTSPPYWGLRDYKTEPIIFDGQADCEHDFSIEFTATQSGGINSISGNGKTQPHHEAKTNFCSKCGAWLGQLGLEPSPEHFIKHLLDIFDLFKPILKDTGSVFVNLGDTYSSSGSSSQPTHTSFGKLTQAGYKTTGHRAEGLPPKCLCLIPQRFAWGMINPNWELREDLTDEEKQYVIGELIKRKII